MRASRSASASHGSSAAMTEARAGTPLGKSACSSASWVVVEFGLLRACAPVRPGVEPLREEERLRLVAAVFAAVAAAPVTTRVVVRAAVPLRAAAGPVRRTRLLLLGVAEREVPAMPCERLRCAPSAEARLNSRPHSGHTNWLVEALLEEGLVAIEQLPSVASVRCGDAAP
jgi:hypothetical protein